MSETGSSSPITAPNLPPSEPPTPTTAHVSVSNSLLDNSNFRVGDNGTGNLSFDDTSDIDGITGGSISGSIAGSMIGGTNAGTTTRFQGAPSFPPSSNSQPSFQSNQRISNIHQILPLQRSLPKSHLPNHLSQYSITSSCRSVKSVGSSIIDTDFEKDADYVNAAGAPVPLAIAAEDDEDFSESSSRSDGDNENDNSLHRHRDHNSGSFDSPKGMMEFLSDFRNLTIQKMNSIQSQQKRDMDHITSMLQNESNRRTALEGRLHAQLLLQSETMVAMEVKLLRLEAKVEKKEAAQKRKMALHSLNLDGSSHVQGQSHNQGHGVGNSIGAVNPYGGIGLGIGSGVQHHAPSAFHHPHSISMNTNIGGRLGSASIAENETIDEEEDFVMTDIREIQVRTSRNNSGNANVGTGGSNTSGLKGGMGNTAGGGSLASSLGSRDGSRIIHSHSHSHPHSSNPTNIAVVSSGASLASGVTATSFLEETHGVEDQVRDHEHDNRSARSNDGDVEDEGDGGDIIEDDGSASTPTQGGSRSHFRFASDMQPVSNLESILLNPIQHTTNNELGLSTRAVRGDHYDGNSSLATSVTNTTVTSTIVTATTRGNDSINPRSFAGGTMGDRGSVVGGQTSTDSRILSMDGADEEVELATAASNDESDGADLNLNLGTSTPNMSQRDGGDFILGLSPPAVSASASISIEQGTDQEQERPPRNESPLTVQSAATANVSVGQSVASAINSVGTSILSSAAVAPARSFRARREVASRMGSGYGFANRVVSFTSDQVFGVPPEISEAGDSIITMPDELDNLSDVADEFANRARLWRDEYEARLDSIQKRWSGE